MIAMVKQNIQNGDKSSLEILSVGKEVAIKLKVFNILDNPQ
jgi:hypothetical protein